ncbi:hypothetical protein M231_03413 [Tremella mesenterica]|uniref:Uncharacterized protein n=1 Tax=Tremella mesenterica TaxID=5217 RepID=A0A4Q1BNB5_TREME|nr:hypothetical protein M231_03413 [Tremella mesenterica]
MPQMSYAKLTHSLMTSQAVVRVHNSQSTSPLVQSGMPDTSGFFAPSPLFASVTPRTYHLILPTSEPPTASLISITDDTPNQSVQRSGGRSSIPLPLSPINKTVPPLSLPNTIDINFSRRTYTTGQPSQGSHANGQIPRNQYPSARATNERMNFRSATAQKGQIDDMFEGTWMRELIVDHINGWRRPCPALWKAKYPQETRNTDELSPWISCSASLDWAIWNIAKQLSRMKGKSDKVWLTIVRLDGPEKWHRPFAHPRSPRVEDQSPFRYDLEFKARRKAEDCKEVLAYGRIFGNSIIAVLPFSISSTPFPLPDKFWRHPSNPSSGPGWVGRLCWDAERDYWETAKMALGLPLQQMITPTFRGPVRGTGSFGGYMRAWA